MNDLSEKHQRRLDAWATRLNNLAHKPKDVPKQPNYVPRGDYGDDIRDYEAKDKAMWDKVFLSNPIYEGYR